MKHFTERHTDKIMGTLSCFDRILIMGTIPNICYAQGITGYFHANKIRIFDYAQWAKPLRDKIRANAEHLTQKNNLEIEFIRKVDGFRKEARVKEIIEERGDHPGLVHIFSAMEGCSTYKPWHDKKTHQTFLRPDVGKCLHYYFYFIDPELGLCHLRVPTWAPFRLQFYFNGHNLLANRLRNKNIGFDMMENAFVRLDDFEKAQRLADTINIRKLHRIFDKTARLCCPVISCFPQNYHWSIMQAEYATDIIFKRPQDLAPIYEDLVRTTIHAVKPDNVAMFLGRKLHGRYEGELGNRFSTRIEGRCIKHYMGRSGIKMYDKFGSVLRIETVSNDVSFFKHYRRVEHRDGTWEMKHAPMRKSIYSLGALAEALGSCNRRYLEFISAVDDPSNGIHDVNKISRPVRDEKRSYRGFNLFHGTDEDIFRTIAHGEFCISGFRNQDLRRHLPKRKAWWISHVLKRLRKHGIIKKVRTSYKYYLTSLGKRVVITALKLKEMFVIPYLRGLLIPS